MLEGDALIKEMLSCFHTARLDTIFSHIYLLVRYSHHSNNRGGWNKRGGGTKVAKSIKVEGGIFWKKLVHKSNKRGVEGEKI